MKKFLPVIKLVGITILFFVISIAVSYAETFSLSSLESYEICRRDYIIERASQIDRLVDCKAIKGDLMIKNTHLKNLDALENLQYVGGNLTIKNNDELENISGLRNLQEIGLDLRLYENNSLVDLEGLESLRKIRDDLTIRNNDKLMDISAFGELIIEDTVEISFNATLENLKGLKDVVVNGTSIRIVSNQMLPTCEAERFANQLQENGLSDHVSVDIIDNDDEGECTEEMDCETDVVIEDSYDLEAMKKCSVILGNLTIQNTDLTNLEGLKNLYYVNGHILIQNNDSLESISALSNLQNINGNLRIASNDLLVDLDGLNSIKSLDALLITRNINLKDLSALNNITVRQLIRIVGNDALESLEDLKDIVFHGTQLEIISNSSLPTCYAENFVENLKENGWSGEAVIINNDDEASVCEENLCETDVVINDVYDLENIKNCSVIAGNLTINNTTLTTLEGLEELYYVDGSLRILNNPKLVSLSALKDLQDIAGDLTISNNDSLLDLAGLGSINSVEAFEILYNDELNDLSALAKITINEKLQINDNSSLKTLEGLSEITLNATELEIAFNNNLPTCEAENFVQALEEKGWLGEAVIFYNDDETSCVDENLCETDVVITNGDDLENITNCAVINGDLTIVNTDLITLDGLEKLYYINGSLRILNNSQLVSISALSDLQDISGDLTISNNGSLVNLDGLGSIDGVNALEIIYNNELNDLSGLMEIIVNEKLQIKGNSSLENLDGLSEITLNGSELEISFNSNLPTCEAEEFVEMLKAKGWKKVDKNLIITGNDDNGICGEVEESVCDSHVYIYTIEDLESIKNCTVIEGSLRIKNSSLTNLDYLKNLNTIKGSLAIVKNSSLTSLSGLHNLKRVEGDVIISSNRNLRSLDGLNSLYGIGPREIYLSAMLDYNGMSGKGSLKINNNPSLKSLRGLKGLKYLYNFQCIGNVELATCDIESFVDYLEGNGWSGKVEISGNNRKCN